jgi:hypothetical protein
MTTPEQLLARRRRRILNEDAIESREPQTSERDESWLRDFVDHLNGVIRNKSGKG